LADEDPAPVRALHGTRVVCNPRGCAKDGIDENPRFDAGLTIDV
jgi:hypothetical protein